MTSKAVSDSPSIEFLFDFIYLDRPRIASYFSQLFEKGVLKQTKEMSHLSESSATKGKAGLPGMGLEHTANDALSESLERQYDAEWSLPINVINRLDELNFIQRNIKTTPMGQLVQIQGSLRIIDIRMLKDMWGTIMNIALNQSTNHVTPKQHAKKKKESEPLAEMLSKLPHALQMSLFMDEGEAWSTLNPEHMTINPDDLAFKHGADIAGQWFLLGVVDAHPEDLSQSLLYSSRELENGMLQVLKGIREFFGRPYTAYGITPIAIFRPIRK